MYGASVGDTGIFEGVHKGVVRAIAVWSPFEHAVVFFRNRDSHSTASRFERVRVVLTEKSLDFRIDAVYRDMKSMDFDVGEYRPEFVKSEENE